MYIIPLIPRLNMEGEMYAIKKGLNEANEKANIINIKLDEIFDTIKWDLEVIKDYMPKMEGQINEVLDELYIPLSTTQKLKIVILIIPLLVSYEQENNVPKLVAEKIHELKNLILSLKGSGKKF
jgi:hypothetical protein